MERVYPEKGEHARTCGRMSGRALPGELPGRNFNRLDFVSTLRTRDRFSRLRKRGQKRFINCVTEQIQTARIG